MSTLDLIKAIASGSAIATEDTFNSVMAEKIGPALDSMRQSVAKNMFNAEAYEQLDELSLNVKSNAYAKRYSRDNDGDAEKADKTLKHIKNREGSKGVMHAKNNAARMAGELDIPHREKEKAVYAKEEFDFEEEFDGYITEEQFEALSDAEKADFEPINK